MTSAAATAIVLEGQRDALELVLQGASLARVLERLAMALEKQSRTGALASILLADEDGKHLLLGAAPSLPAAFNRAIDGIAVAAGMGACGTAAYTRQTVVVRDAATDPLCEAFRQLAAEHGLRSCWSTPILSSHGTLLGTFALYHRVATEPSPEDRQMVDLLSSTAALAIERGLNERLRERFDAQVRAIQSAHEARLRASWQVVQALFDEAPAAIALIRGGDLTIELVNKLCVQVWQRSSPADLLNKPLLEALPELADQGFAPLLLGVMSSGEPYFGTEVAVGVRGASGERKTSFFDFVYAPMRNENGVVDGVGVFAFDVTDAVHTRRELEEASRAREEFLAIISHELRTPIHAIIGWARLLQGPSDEDAIKRGIDTILRNALTQDRLIEDLVDLGRLATSKLKLDFAEVDINELVSISVDVVRPAAKAKSVELDIALDPVSQTICADGARLQQVLWNLFANAVKFSEKGGQVQIVAKHDERQVEIEVTDQGAGIAPDFLPQVFERFKQHERVKATKRGGGLGLGLAIAREVIELHGGSIEATSDGVGRGARFVVRLPIRS